MNNVSATSILEAPVLLAARQKPQTHGDLCGVEELPGQGDHAVDEIGLDDGFADLAFAGLARRHRTVGEDEAGDAGGCQVVDEVLDPGVVGIPGRRHAAGPQRLSSLSNSPRQSLSLKGGLART
jgi:hypothetical protein